MAQGVQAKFESAILVDLAGKQAVLWFAELNEAVQLQFRQYDDLVVGIGTQVNQAAVVFLYLGDRHGPVFNVRDLLADLVSHATEGGIIDRIGSLLVCGRKTHLNPAVCDFEDDSETQLGLGITDPALTGLDGGGWHKYARSVIQVADSKVKGQREQVRISVPLQKH